MATTALVSCLVGATIYLLAFRKDINIDPDKSSKWAVLSLLIIPSVSFAIGGAIHWDLFGEVESKDASVRIFFFSSLAGLGMCSLATLLPYLSGVSEVRTKPVLAGAFAIVRFVLAILGLAASILTILSFYLVHLRE